MRYAAILAGLILLSPAAIDERLIAGSILFAAGIIAREIHKVRETMEQRP